MFKNLIRIRFDRNEVAGAFGDIGTDLPLIVAMILAAGLDSTSALVMFGTMQILTALIYRMPMPVQPLKAMAAIVITQEVSGNILYGGGLAIGVLMFILTITKLIDLLAKVVPKCVIRGIQFGLGIKLSLLALGDYVASEGAYGYWLAGVAFILTVFLIGNRKFPAALFVIILGIIYAFIFSVDGTDLVANVGLRLPQLHVPEWTDILTGLVVLAIPQIPLSLGNSVLATKQVSDDLFPDRKSLTVRKISFTYSFMNLINPFFSGIPTCHGSGGMAGHYTFGGRTGGSVVIYGSIYLFIGLFLSRGFENVIHIFPLPVLGVILLFEGIALMVFIRDIIQSKSEFSIAILVALMAGGLTYGFVVGLLAGTSLYYLSKKGMVGV
ncbi:putative sulfate/molybdate transporter [Acidobacteria bacterium AH-259-D05]|nr:putative sulfate/molybdate transporter [Acidobacteria bacterium AH-259-D05]